MNQPSTFYSFEIFFNPVLVLLRQGFEKSLIEQKSGVTGHVYLYKAFLKKLFKISYF